MIAVKDIPNLKFNVRETEDGSKFREHLGNSPEGIGEVVEVKEINDLLPTGSRLCADTLLSTEDCEHSRKSLRSTAGVAPKPVVTENDVKMKSIVNSKDRTSEYRESSQNSQKSEAGVAVE